MKIKFALAVAALVSLMSLGCSKDDNAGSKKPGDDGPVDGWVLQSWNGTTEMAGKVYLALDEGSFTLYQLVNTSGFKRFRGTYAIAEGIIDGVYDDQKPWSEKYEISGEDTHTMTLKGVDSQVVSVYKHTTIPDYVKDNVTISSLKAGAGADGDARFL